MTRDGAIDVVSGHVNFCEKYEQRFCTFTVETCKAILYYLQHPEDFDMEAPKDDEARTMQGMS